jgi:hypothetical protein
MWELGNRELTNSFRGADQRLGPLAFSLSHWGSSPLR